MAVFLPRAEALSHWIYRETIDWGVEVGGCQERAGEGSLFFLESAGSICLHSPSCRISEEGHSSKLIAEHVLHI